MISAGPAGRTLQNCAPASLLVILHPPIAYSKTEFSPSLTYHPEPLEKSSNRRRFPGGWAVAGVPSGGVWVAVAVEMGVGVSGGGWVSVGAGVSVGSGVSEGAGVPEGAEVAVRVGVTGVTSAISVWATRVLMSGVASSAAGLQAERSMKNAQPIAYPIKVLSIDFIDFLLRSKKAEEQLSSERVLNALF
jgi:hypothetical protein